MATQTFQQLLETKQNKGEITEGFLYFGGEGKLIASEWCEVGPGITYSLDREERPEELIPMDKVKNFIQEKRDPEATYSEFSVYFELTEEGWLVVLEGNTEEEEGVYLGAKVIS
jgi:hypothetical protein